VDFAFVRRLTARFYSHTGQPSVDPVVLLRMALLGYLYGIASERRLAEEIRLNLAYLWFLGYDPDETPPDHSVLSKARRRFGPSVYQAFFTEIVRQCERAGLVRGGKLYVDSTLVEADACLDSVGSRTLLAQLPEVGAYVARLRRENPDPTLEGGPPMDPRPAPAAAAAAPEGAAAQADPPAARATAPVAPVRTAPGPVPPAALDPAAAPVPRPHPTTAADPPNKALGRVNQWVVSRSGMPLDLYYKVHVGVDAGRARIVTAVEVTGGAVARFECPWAIRTATSCSRGVSPPGPRGTLGRLRAAIPISRRAPARKPAARPASVSVRARSSTIATASARAAAASAPRPRASSRAASSARRRQVSDARPLPWPAPTRSGASPRPHPGGRVPEALAPARDPRAGRCRFSPRELSSRRSARPASAWCRASSAWARRT
jgi:transposase